MDYKGLPKAMATKPDGEIIFKSTYDEIFPELSGVYTVLSGYYFGCVNENGIEILPAEYECIEIADENMFIVKKQGKYGVLDKMRNEIVPLEYMEIVQTFTNIFFLNQKISGDITT